MPRIFDNIEDRLLPALQDIAQVSHRGDFCVGYFNLRGWRQLDEQVDRWTGGAANCCRLLIGMQKLPEQELEEAYRLLNSDAPLDNQRALRLKRAMAQQFRDQLTVAAPTNADEAGLRMLATIPVPFSTQTAALSSRALDLHGGRWQVRRCWSVAVTASTRTLLFTRALRSNLPSKRHLRQVSVPTTRPARSPSKPVRRPAVPTRVTRLALIQTSESVTHRPGN